MKEVLTDMNVKTRLGSQDTRYEIRDTGRDRQTRCRSCTSMASPMNETQFTSGWLAIRKLGENTVLENL